MLPEATPSALSSRPAKLPAAILLLLTAAVFAHSVSFDFTFWDDHENLTWNARFNPPTLDTLRHYWTHEAFSLYVPITFSVWALFAWIGQTGEPDVFGITLNPYVFRAGNLLIHLLAVYLAFTLLRRLLRHQWGAFAAAMVFAIHPIQVETVCWPSGTKDLLCGLFAIICCGQYLRYRETEAHGSPRRRHLAAVGVAFVLAVLSKPQGMMIPALLLAIDWLVMGTPVLAILKRIGWLFVLVIPFAILTKMMQPALAVYSPQLWQRPLIAADAIGFYLLKIIWPAKLGIDYGHEPSRVLASASAYFYAAVALLATTASLWAAKRDKIFLAALLVLWIPISPVLGLVRFSFQTYSTVADHYLYVALLGPGLLIGWAVRQMPRRSAAALCGALACILAIRSYLQTFHWRDDQTLFEHAVRVNPLSYAGWNNLGDAQNRRGQLEQAAESFAGSIQVNPQWQTPYRNLSEILRARAQMSSPLQSRELALQAASLRMEVARRLREEYPDALQIRLDEFFAAEMYLQAGKADQAIEILQKLESEHPDSPRLRELISQARATTQPATGPD